MVVSLCVSPATDWQPSQGVPCLMPNGSWDRLQPSREPKLDKQKRIGKQSCWTYWVITYSTRCLKKRQSLSQQMSLELLGSFSHLRRWDQTLGLQKCRYKKVSLQSVLTKKVLRPSLKFNMTLFGGKVGLHTMDGSAYIQNCVQILFRSIWGEPYRSKWPPAPPKNKTRMFLNYQVKTKFWPLSPTKILLPDLKTAALLRHCRNSELKQLCENEPS